MPTDAGASRPDIEAIRPLAYTVSGALNHYSAADTIKDLCDYALRLEEAHSTAQLLCEAVLDYPDGNLKLSDLKAIAGRLKREAGQP